MFASKDVHLHNWTYIITSHPFSSLDVNNNSLENEQNKTFHESVHYVSLYSNNSLLTSNDNNLNNIHIQRSIAETLIVSLALGSLILATALGNIFVISAIISEKNLKCVGNYLVLSLAVTDLLVACLVMPLGALYEVNQEWTLGSKLCELWTCTDVLCCTASILHLLAIACDRFWAVTNVDYVHQRNARHIGGMIITVWVVSAIISLAPILGWKDADFNRRIEQDKRCMVSQDISYQIFATMFSFYVPSALVVILYYRIYLEAKKRIRRKSSRGVHAKNRRPNSCPPIESQHSTEMTVTTVTCNVSSSNASSDNGSAHSYQVLVATGSRQWLSPPQPQNVPLIIPDFISTEAASQSDAPSCESQKDSHSDTVSQDVASCSTVSPNGDTSFSNNKTRTNRMPLRKLKTKKSKSTDREVECKRERKAAKTLAIITGIFIVSWLPFFVIALIMPICPSCMINPYVFSFCLWLGWANSSVNPFLYTIFSPDFRCAFRRMLFGRRFRKR